MNTPPAPAELPNLKQSAGDTVHAPKPAAPHLPRCRPGAELWAMGTMFDEVAEPVTCSACLKLMTPDPNETITAETLAELNAAISPQTHAAIVELTENES